MRTAAIIGTGVVGTATAALLKANQFAVFGEDTRREALTGFPGRPLDEGREVASWDLIVIAVPTPVESGSMSTAALRDALSRAAELASASSGEPLVAVRSTVMPGTVAREVAPAVHPSPVCYWPSFARERTAADDEFDPRVVVFGTSNEGQVRAVLGQWIDTLQCPVRFVTFEEAELAKVGANAFNATKISYFNALGDWSSRAGARTQQVAEIASLAAEGAWNPAYGIRVGPAFGGACLPKDLEALTTWAREGDAPHAELLDAVRAVNESPLREAADSQR